MMREIRWRLLVGLLFYLVIMTGAVLFFGEPEERGEKATPRLEQLYEEHKIRTYRI